jgi:hypothetical protein
VLGQYCLSVINHSSSKRSNSPLWLPPHKICYVCFHGASGECPMVYLMSNLRSTQQNLFIEKVDHECYFEGKIVASALPFPVWRAAPPLIGHRAALAALQQTIKLASPFRPRDCALPALPAFSFILSRVSSPPRPLDPVLGPSAPLGPRTAPNHLPRTLPTTTWVRSRSYLDPHCCGSLLRSFAHPSIRPSSSTAWPSRRR